MEKKILITNYELINFTGSEINSMSIAKRFKDLGYKVYMLAMFVGEPLCSRTKDCYDEVIDIVNDEFDFSSIEFDLVWAHHSFILSWLIFDKQLKAKKIIISSLSPKEILEAVPSYANDLNLVIGNSQETKQKLEQEGIKNVHLLENYSFKKYFERNIKINQLKNIAIITNHIPDELIEAKGILERNNYKVQVYGFQGKRELITNEILEQYDLIVTIGKTVQYAMSLKIPVYVYDIYGGEGYLSIENLEKNRSKNFSGRGFDKKTPEVIYQEITGGFEQALQKLGDLKEYAQNNFCFEDHLDEICEILDNQENIDLDSFREKYENEYRMLMQAKQMFINMEDKYAPKLQELKEKNQEIINLNIRSKAQQLAMDNLKAENEKVKADYQKLKEKIEKIPFYKAYKKLKSTKK